MCVCVCVCVCIWLVYLVIIFDIMFIENGLER